MQSLQASVRLVVGAALGAVLFSPPGASAGVSGFCGNLSGVQFGLCNAYCNAQACPQNPQPSCEVLRRNWQRQTGSTVFPCDNLPTRTPTQGVQSPTPSFTPTGVPTGTATATAVVTTTPVLTATAVATATAIDTATPINTATAIFTPTAVDTPTGVPTGTAAATATPTGVPTGTAAGTFTPTGVPTGTTAVACVGDCGGDYTVTIDDLMMGVSIVLGLSTPEDCPMMAESGVTMTIHELIQGVINALQGCLEDVEDDV